MEPRNRRKSEIGLVTSDKMNKTITVRAERLVKHPLYKKYIRRFRVFKVHDENEEASVGDRVEITETRPLSKTKRWRLVRILKPFGGPPAEQPSQEVGG